MRHWIFKCWRARTYASLSNRHPYSLSWPASSVRLDWRNSQVQTTTPSHPPEPGDQVVLLRTGKRAAIVAIGVVEELLSAQDGVHRRDPACTVSFEETYFDTPILWEAVLADPEFTTPRWTPDDHSFAGGNLPTLITFQQWSIVTRHCTQPTTKTPDTIQWKIKPGQILDRAELHDVYGGTRTGTVSPSTTHPSVFLFQKWHGENSLKRRLQDAVTEIEVPELHAQSVAHHMREGRSLRLFQYVDEGGRRVEYCGQHRVGSNNPIVDVTKKEELRTSKVGTRRYKSETRRYLINLKSMNKGDYIEDMEPKNIRIGNFVIVEDDPKPDRNRSLNQAIKLTQPEVGATTDEILKIALSVAAALTERQVLDVLSNDRDGSILLEAVQLSARLATLNKAADELEESLDEGIVDESYYQQWCETHSWAFGAAYAVRDKVRTIAVGDQVDMLMEHTANGLRDIFELKRPDRDPLGWDSNHKCFYWSAEATRAIGQCHRYIDALHDAARKGLRDNPQIVAYHPRAFIIVGRSATWDQEKLKALHGLNSRLHSVQIMTYDQLLTQAKRLIETLTTEALK